jgi:gamma-glutamylcyclotransferase (GGCT)/AIG2-like uncharacterized protein YtfP
MPQGGAQQMSLPTVDQPTRLFVYGTLRAAAQRGPRPAMVGYKILESGAVFEGTGWVTGKLYALSWFPAFVDEKEGRVIGEVWRITEPSVLKHLNGFDGRDYDRQLHKVTLEDGRRVTAWTYRYNLSVEGVPLIASGDYLDWLRERDMSADARNGHSRAGRTTTGEP